MLSYRELEPYLQKLNPALVDIVLELRNLIASIAPGVTEVLLWGGLTYYAAERGGPVSAGVCQIGFEKDHIRLAFIHGAFLPDPHRLLEGSRKAKRFVRLTSYEDAPWEDLQELIRASANFDPRHPGDDRKTK